MVYLSLHRIYPLGPYARTPEVVNSGLCSAAKRLQAVCPTFACRLSSGYGAVRTR